MKIYLVGGSVRDRLLNLPNSDRDWLVVGATPKEMLKKGFKQVGKNFPVFLHPITQEEYALARTEKKTAIGHTGFSVDFSSNITLEQDLLRRDLTINAIAQDENGHYHDPFHGIDDLNHRILRHTSSAFSEDPLRVLRVARFAAKFHHLNFKISPETLQLMKQISQTNEISSLPSERIWQETEKALQTQNPQIYFQTLINCEAFFLIFHEFLANKNDDNLFKNAFIFLEKTSQNTKDIMLRFAAFFAFLIEKTQKNQIKKFCFNKLKIPNHFQKKLNFLMVILPKLDHINHFSSSNWLELLYDLNAFHSDHLFDDFIICAKTKQIKNFNKISNFLQRCIQLTNQIDVQKIIDSGAKSLEIKTILDEKRLEIINNIKL